MDTKLLEEIGLSEGETKVYLALLRIGSTKTGLLAKEAQVSYSKVYKILDRLVKKGLAGHVIKGKIQYFSAMEPRRILEYVEEKEKQLAEKKKQVEMLLPSLEKEKTYGIPSNAVVYEGFKAVTNAIRAIPEELKPNEEYCVLGATYGEVPGLREFFYGYHLMRAKKGVKLKMLANADIRNKIEAPTYKKAEIRFLPQYLISKMQIFFYKNKALMVLWTKSPTAFLIQNEEAVNGFRTYFEAFWKIAKK
jgi:HTH-type transcriptional regulator, sugar sensing transcriptional regulator